MPKHSASDSGRGTSRYNKVSPSLFALYPCCFIIHMLCCTQSSYHFIVLMLYCFLSHLCTIALMLSCSYALTLYRSYALMLYRSYALSLYSKTIPVVLFGSTYSNYFCFNPRNNLYRDKFLHLHFMESLIWKSGKRIVLLVCDLLS